MSLFSPKYDDIIQAGFINRTFFVAQFMNLVNGAVIGGTAKDAFLLDVLTQMVYKKSHSLESLSSIQTTVAILEQWYC